MTYFNPNLASLSATSFGILRINFSKFLLHSIIAFAYWNIFWGFLFYFLGDRVEDYMNYQSIIIAVIVIILLRIIYVAWKKRVIR